MHTNKKAVITGITGQDGYYLSHLLLSKGYEVIGIRRRRANPGASDRRVEKMRDSIPNFHLEFGDVTDLSSIMGVVGDYQPHEFYHLAAQSFVGKSWEIAGHTLDVTGIGTYNCLEAIRRIKKDCKFYFAGSSEQYGNVGGGSSILDEKSYMYPESPYAVAKVMGYNIAQVYRKSYNMFISCGILFNHESEIRGEEFVTRKITSQLARISHGSQSTISLGNMDSRRDWGHSRDYVEAMYLMLQADYPDEYVIATGESHSVKEFFDLACDFFELDASEVLIIDEDFIRPNDVNHLLGNANKARKKLGWTPKMKFKELVESMCKYDLYAQNPHPSISAAAEDLLWT